VDTSDRLKGLEVTMLEGVEARADVFHYTEGFYDRRRLHGRRH
jgi:hypothetical protein